MSNERDITGLLRAWGQGDEEALSELTPLIYDELHQLAMRIFSGEQPGHTLQPTALVNEAYAKLIGAEVAWQDRAHFFALTARMMRRLLVNHALARKADKRGGKAIHVTLSEVDHSGQESDIEMLKLDEALSELSEFDPQKAELIELQYFAGLTFKEMEEVTGLSSSTLDRHLRTARAWLKTEISEAD